MVGVKDMQIQSNTSGGGGGEVGVNAGKKTERGGRRKTNGLWYLGQGKDRILAEVHEEAPNHFLGSDFDS